MPRATRWCDPRHVVMLEPPSFPEPVVSMALEPVTRGDNQKLATSLARVSDEDPTFRFFTDPETGQCIIAGMGELHLDVIRLKLDEQHGVKTIAGAPAIAYRETVRAKAKADHLLKKQSGGSGMYARVVLAVEPGSTGSGIVITNEVAGGRIPSEFLSAVHRGIRDAAKSGVLARYPMVDVKVTIIDGAAHVKDSDELSFRLAAEEALREAVRAASPVILEPIMRVECSVPSDHQGDLLGDLNRRRGRITAVGEKYGTGAISAEVPLAEMFGYANAIRSLSRGRAEYTMMPSRFEQVPSEIAADIVAANH